jgi:hypothetical protein
MHFAFLPNVAVSNDVLSLPISPSLRISAAVWRDSRTGSIESARLNCLAFALEQVWRHYPNSELWLLASHRGVQPDTKIVRHFGLWKSLEKRGAAAPIGAALCESIVEVEGGVRLFGATTFTTNQLDKVAKVMSCEFGVIVAATDARIRNTLERLVTQGWSQGASIPEEIVEAVCPEKGLVVGVFGEFDDGDVAVAVLGEEELTVSLNN